MTKLKSKQVTMIECGDLDGFVEETYGRIYNFQQQDDCKERGIEYITVPVKLPFDFKNDTVPEIINDPKMGVSFKAWLERDPMQPLSNSDDPDYHLELWWTRNFYPSLDMIMNDLHEKGLIEAGNYAINIDW